MERVVPSGFAYGPPKSAPLLQAAVPFGRRAGSMRKTEAQDLLVMQSAGSESQLDTCSTAVMALGSPEASPSHMDSSSLRVQRQQDSPLYTSRSVPLHSTMQQPRSVSHAKPLSVFHSLLDARLEATSRALAPDKEASYTLSQLPCKGSSGLSPSSSTYNLPDQLLSAEAQHTSLLFRLTARQGSFSRSRRKSSIFPVSMQADDKLDHLPRPKSGRGFNFQELRQQAAAKASTGNAATQFFKRVLKGIGMGSDDLDEYEYSSPSIRSVRPEHPSKKAAERKPRESNCETVPEDATRRRGANSKPLLGTDWSTHVIRSMARKNCRW